MLQSIYVSTTGNDRTRALTSTALRTLDAAWRTIPKEQTLTTGYEILLAPGTYADDTPAQLYGVDAVYIDAPVIIRGTGREPWIQGDLNLYNTHYLYLGDLVGGFPLGWGGGGDHKMVIGCITGEPRKVNHATFMRDDISGALGHADDMECPVWE